MKKKVINTFTAVVIKTEGVYAGYIEEVPGVNSLGETEEEAFDNLVAPLADIIEANRESADELRAEACDREKKPHVTKRPISIEMPVFATT